MAVKNILFPLLASNKGGNILSAASICKNINKKKYKIHILLIFNKREEKKNLLLLKNSNSYSINYLKSKYKKNSLYSKIILFFQLICFFISKKFDIVHTNDGSLKFFFSLLNLIFKFNLIIHLRNTDNSRRNYIPFAISKKIICISNFVKNINSNMFNNKKVVLYNYVDFFYKNVKLKEKHKILLNKNKKKKIILYVSNIHERKKPINFLKIIKELSKIDKNYLGLMFFQSNKIEYAKIKNYIKKYNISKNIYLFYNLPAHYWMPLIKKVNKIILLATSINEPLGRNLIEAIFNNIFVIANNSGGHKEIINNKFGILRDTNKIKKISITIHKVFKNKKYFIKNKDLSSIKKKFQNKNYFKKIENIYSNI